MIAFVEGKVAEKNPGELVLNAGGVGFSLMCSSATLAAAPAMGESWRCYTVMNVREDAMELFGFATKQEREMFRRLCTVTGVGAKTALGVLSALPMRELSVAIVTGDVTALSRAPGIGKKTAERLLLELKDKVGPVAAESADSFGEAVAAGGSGAVAEAIEALASLGYSNSEIMPIIKKIEGAETKTSEEILKQALRLMMK